MGRALTPSLVMAQGLVLGVIFLGIVPLFLIAFSAPGETLRLDRSVFNVLGFTLYQASLSSLISVGLGIFVARALARHEFPGRSFLLSLFTLPNAVPAIVAVLGLTALFGRSGVLPGLIKLYGLPGILMAHVFFNLPLSTRYFFQALQTAAPEGFKLGGQLGFTPPNTFRRIEWPLLRPVIPRVSALIFLLCAASFVIVLTFGGVSTTTLEVAIYQSLRLDFDVPRALQLSALQVVLCLSLIGVAAKSLQGDVASFNLKRHVRRFDQLPFLSRLGDAALVAAACALVLPLLVVIVVEGAAHLQFTVATLKALLTSFGIGIAAALLALLAAWPLARSQRAASLIITLLPLMFPPAVTATGWFVALRGLGDSLALTIALVVLLNALMALPFASASLAPGFAKLLPAHDKISSQLGLLGWNRFWIVDFPILRRHVAQGFLLAAVLSLGDLTAIILLGANGLTTLPSLIREQMGHYRGADAQGTALFLLLSCFALAYAAQELGKADD